ncbi:hypothetical protein EON65_14200 [archaeon]|nr:MAG: hypothetical protein EON65_14200 [archaeon]
MAGKLLERLCPARHTPLNLTNIKITVRASYCRSQSSWMGKTSATAHVMSKYSVSPAIGLLFEQCDFILTNRLSWTGK